MKNWAEKYTALGWTVIPTPLNKKYPSIEWKKYQTEKPDINEFDWSGGLAVLTGKCSGVVVVDLDSPDNTLQLDSTVISQTQSGGRHFFYRYSEELRNTVRINGAPIDFRGDGGLVIVAPTKYNGNSYKWLKPPTKEAMEALPVLPDVVKALLEKPSQKVDLAKAINLKVGERDSTLLKIADSLCAKHPQPEWSTVVWPILVGINQNFQPPLPETDVVRIFNQAQKFINKSVDVLPQLTKFSEMTPEELTHVVSRERLSVGLERFDNVFGWPSGSYLIIGHPGSGKSWLALWLARQFFERHGKKTVFWSLEMSAEGTKNRLLQSWSDKTLETVDYGQNTSQAENLLKQNAISLQTWEDTNIDLTPEIFLKMAEEHIKQGYEVIIVDHFHHLPGVGGDNDSNQKSAGLWSKAFSDFSKAHPDKWLVVMAQPNEGGNRERILRPENIKGSKTPRIYFEYIITLSTELIEANEGDLSLKNESRKRILYVWKNRNGEQFFGEATSLLPTGNFLINEKSDLEAEVIRLFGAYDD